MFKAPVNMHSTATQLAYVAWSAEVAIQKLRNKGYHVPNLHITVSTLSTATEPAQDLVSGVVTEDMPREATADERISQAVTLTTTAAQMKEHL